MDESLQSFIIDNYNEHMVKDMFNGLAITNKLYTNYDILPYIEILDSYGYDDTQGIRDRILGRLRLDLLELIDRYSLAVIEGSSIGDLVDILSVINTLLDIDDVTQVERIISGEEDYVIKVCEVFESLGHKHITEYMRLLIEIPERFYNWLVKTIADNSDEFDKSEIICKKKLSIFKHFNAFMGDIEPLGVTLVKSGASFNRPFKFNILQIVDEETSNNIEFDIVSLYLMSKDNISDHYEVIANNISKIEDDEFRGDILFNKVMVVMSDFMNYLKEIEVKNNEQE